MSKRPRAAALIIVVAVVASVGASVAAATRPGHTVRVSVATDGAEGNKDSSEPAISADGNVVAFRSRADNLVPGDTNGEVDLFVRDLRTGVTERVSVGTGGFEADGVSSWPALSADGSVVAFLSDAKNLAAPKDDPFSDIYVRDRARDTTELVSGSVGGVRGLVATDRPALSADARLVAFGTYAALLPEDTNDVADVYLRDRTTGALELVSWAADRSLGNGDSRAPSMSADGRYVAFVSDASNLVPGDINSRIDRFNGRDVFVRDRVEGTTRRVSVAGDGSEANGPSFSAAIDAGGSVVVFDTIATNLVPGDRNRAIDVFTHELATGRTSRISLASDGVEPDWDSRFLTGVSADGRAIAFWSAASNLTLEDRGGENYATHVYLHDRLAKTTERVSLTPDGLPAEPGSWEAVLSGDGRRVVFSSNAPDLVPGDTNGCGPENPLYCAVDVFVRDVGPREGFGALSATANDARARVSGWVRAGGATISDAVDAPERYTPADRGVDIADAALRLRPEEGDLHLTISIPDLPSVRSPTGGMPATPGFGNWIWCPICFPESVAVAPGISWGADLAVDGVRHRVVVSGTSATPSIVLSRCTPRCEEVGALWGAIGTSEERIDVAVPLSLVGATAGSLLSDLRVFSARGTDADERSIVDELRLPDAAVRLPVARAAAAPRGQVPDEASFVPVSLRAGSFDAQIDLAPGDEDIWVEFCGVVACSRRVARV